MHQFDEQGRAGAGRSWDARSYGSVAAPLEELGREVVDRAGLCGDEAVLDAGCGPGAITEYILGRLPRGRVIAVDSSPAMVEEARRRLGGRADVRLADLLELDLGETVDVVISTATFHWVLDQGRLFERLHLALRPGGRLVAQCGGEGNLAQVLGVAADVAAREPFAAHLRNFERPSLFASDAVTAERLAAAGFDEIDCRLTPRPVVPADPRKYLEAITLGPHLDALPSGLRKAFVGEVLAGLETPAVIDYVRLDIDARRQRPAR